MERAKGIVRLDDGRVMERVRFNIMNKLASDRALGEWHGSFELPAGTLVLPGEAHVKLDDGREATF